MTSQREEWPKVNWSLHILKRGKKKKKKKKTFSVIFFGWKNNGANADLHQEIMCLYFSELQKLSKHKYTLELKCQVE